MSELQFKNNMILQTIKDDETKEITHFKNIKEIERFLENKIPYSALINVYYTCSNKGGGANKKEHKKHIQRKYIELLKRIRIFDMNNKDLIDNEEFFNKLLKC